MKTSIITPVALAVLALAGCAGSGGGGGAGGASAQGGDQANAGQGPATPLPGEQATQAGLIEQRQGQGGPAIALGLPGATAAQALGPPSLQDGQRIATQGAPNGVTACVSCHGAQGEGVAASGFPRIAGQSAYYIGKQLAAYANGARASNPIMLAIAKGLTAEQIRDVSAYYASLGGGAAQAAGAAPAAASGRGAQLAMAGDERKRVQACANCHGPGGAGEPPIYPYLAGQHASYLTTAMQAWKSGSRKTDGSGQMVQIARALSDADVAALSAYFAAQPAPPPAAKRVNIASGSSARPAVAAAAGAPGPRKPGAAAAGVTGSGSEQGSPVTGGGQGPGGGGGTQGTKPPEPLIRR